MKRAYELPIEKARGPRRFGTRPGRVAAWFVVECVCGWSSPLCDSTERANLIYKQHKEE